jgi:hypothetical protein
VRTNKETTPFVFTIFTPPHLVSLECSKRQPHRTFDVNMFKN